MYKWCQQFSIRLPTYSSSPLSSNHRKSTPSKHSSVIPINYRTFPPLKEAITDDLSETTHHLSFHLSDHELDLISITETSLSSDGTPLIASLNISPYLFIHYPCNSINYGVGELELLQIYLHHIQHQ